MTTKIPCPDCGETQTLEMLRYEIMKLKQKKRKKDYDRSISSQGYTTHINPTGPSYTISVPNWTMPVSGTGASPNTGITTGGQISWSNQLGNITFETDPELPVTPKWDGYRFQMDGRPNGAECCVGCGRFYNPHLPEETLALSKEIDELRAEVLHPLECLALESE